MNKPITMMELEEIMSHNDKIVFPQEYVCAILYKDEQVITLYFD